MAFGSPQSRKLLMTMVLLVVALDAVAIGIYYAADIAPSAQPDPYGLRCRVDVGYLGHRGGVHETHSTVTRRGNWAASPGRPVRPGHG